jgi:hypothetical protein
MAEVPGFGRLRLCESRAAARPHTHLASQIRDMGTTGPGGPRQFPVTPSCNR